MCAAESFSLSNFPWVTLIISSVLFVYLLSLICLVYWCMTAPDYVDADFNPHREGSHLTPTYGGEAVITTHDLGEGSVSTQSESKGITS